MKYHIHIPKLLEFALNIICDVITLHGTRALTTAIPYPLYLRCIMTYDKARPSLFRFYTDTRQHATNIVVYGRLYPNVLDHVILVLDDGATSALIVEVAKHSLIDDAAASIQRFASRCLAADKSEMMVKLISQVIMDSCPLPKPIIDVLLFYGAKLDLNDPAYFRRACLRGMNEIVTRAIENGYTVSDVHMSDAIVSGNLDTIEVVYRAYRESADYTSSLIDINLLNATVQSMELSFSLNIFQRGTHYYFSNIPSFSVLQWILDHDVMEHDEMLFDIASSSTSRSDLHFDMLRYLIEQRNFKVPRDTLICLNLSFSADLDVFDYLISHGADVNAVNETGWSVLECSPLLIRYWIDKGLNIKSDDARALMECVIHGMTVPVLEMMIDKYSMDINAVDIFGYTALHRASLLNNYEVVEMLIRHGADVNKRDHDRRTPYEMTTDDCVRQLLVQHGYDSQQSYMNA